MFLYNKGILQPTHLSAYKLFHIFNNKLFCRFLMASRLNASYVSILQRFCDVLAIYAALYIIFNLNSLEITHQAMLVFLCMVSLFQLIGGLTDFYRSWRGVSLFNELIACLKNVLMSSCLLLPFVWFYSDINVALLIQYFCTVLFLMGIMRVFVRLIYAISFKIFKRNFAKNQMRF